MRERWTGELVSGKGEVTEEDKQRTKGRKRGREEVKTCLSWRKQENKLGGIDLGKREETVEGWIHRERDIEAKEIKKMSKPCFKTRF